VAIVCSNQFWCLATQHCRSYPSEHSHFISIQLLFMWHLHFSSLTATKQGSLVTAILSAALALPSDKRSSLLQDAASASHSTVPTCTVPIVNCTYRNQPPSYCTYMQIGSQPHPPTFTPKVSGMANFTPGAPGVPQGQNKSICNAFHQAPYFRWVKTFSSWILLLNTQVLNCSKKLLVALFCQSVSHKTVHFLL